MIDGSLLNVDALDVPPKSFCVAPEMKKFNLNKLEKLKIRVRAVTVRT